MPPTTGGSTSGRITTARRTERPGIVRARQDPGERQRRGAPRARSRRARPRARAGARSRPRDGRATRRASTPGRPDQQRERAAAATNAAPSAAEHRDDRRVAVRRCTGRLTTLDGRQEAERLQRRLSVGPGHVRRRTPARVRCWSNAVHDGDRVGGDHVDVVGDRDRVDVVARSFRHVGDVHDRRRPPRPR